MARFICFRLWLQAALAKLNLLPTGNLWCSLYFPRLLFSGQSFMHLVPSFGSQQAWYILVIAAIMKLVFYKFVYRQVG